MWLEHELVKNEDDEQPYATTWQNLQYTSMVGSHIYIIVLVSTEEEAARKLHDEFNKSIYKT